MRNYINVAIIAIITLVAVSCGNSKSEKQTDSVETNNTEVTESNPRSYNSPDLAFFDLYDNVKSCEFIANENDWDTPQNFSFNEKGMWSNMPKWDEMEIQMFPDIKGCQKYERNKDGYIIIHNELSDMDGLAELKYTWDNEKISSAESDSFLGKTTYVYDEKGLLQTKQTEQHDLEGYEFLLTTYTYSDYEFDGHDNWIKRNVSRTQYEIDDAGRKNFIGEHKFTENRTINYF